MDWAEKLSDIYSSDIEVGPENLLPTRQRLRQNRHKLKWEGLTWSQNTVGPEISWSFFHLVPAMDQLCFKTNCDLGPTVILVHTLGP